MRKARLGKMIVLSCGVLLANGAFAADQAPAPTASEASAAAPAAPAKESAKSFLDSAFVKLAPRFGGDANIEFDTRDSNQGDGLTGRVRLTMDAEIDPLVYIHTRLTAKQYITGHEKKENRFSQAAGYENEAISVGMEQLYLGSKLGPKFNDTEIRAGRQPLWLANGMLADINGINGLYVRTSLLGVNALGFFGREGTHTLQEDVPGKNTNLGAVELSRTFGPVDIGATYLKVDNAFYGVNASYATPFKAKVFAQYVKNTDATDDDQGYRVQVNYGNAAKRGEWDASLAYLRVEDSINPNGKWFVNDGNWIGAKGLRMKAHYALTDWSTLVLVQDLFDNIASGKRQNRTDIEFEVRF